MTDTTSSPDHTSGEPATPEGTALPRAAAAQPTAMPPADYPGQPAAGLPQHAQQFPGQSYQAYPYQAQAYPQPQIAPKNPGLALLASFFFPGLGTLMNGQAGKGIAIFVGYVISWIFTFLLIGIPFLIGFWIWGVVDAYQGAKKWNTAHGVIS